jgi:DNA-binding transcriptional LysR family regulator
VLEPTWLKSFSAVAETLSFTGAAQNLNLRQSTVSQHIRKLEEACGVRLFVRDTHSVRLTQDGEAMIGFSRSILDAGERAMRHFSREELSGLVRLGVTEDVVLAGFADVLRQFRSQHPRVGLELTVGLSDSVREKLDLGKLDLAFIKRRSGDGRGELIWREPLIWIGTPRLAVPLSPSIPLIALAPPAITRSAALAALESIGRSWHMVCTSETQSGIHAAVLAGLGVAPHARSLIPPGVVEVSSSLLPALPDIEFVVLAGRHGNRDPARALADAIKKSGSLLRRSVTA